MKASIILGLRAFGISGVEAGQSCCWSAWGDASTCGNWKGPGAHCNTDPSKSCSSDQDCPQNPVPAPTPTPPPPAACNGFLVTDAGTPGVGGCYVRSQEDLYSAPSFRLNDTQALYRWDGVWRLGTVENGAAIRAQYVAVASSDIPPLGDSFQWTVAEGELPTPAVGSDCRGILALAAGSVEADGCYEQHGEYSSSPLYRLDAERELYRWNGFWRFGVPGVGTQYEALATSATPPSLKPSEWKATAGVAPPPHVFDFASPPSPPPPPMRLVLHEEFDGNALNETLWNVLEQVHRGGVYTRDNVYLEDGKLVLRTVAQNMSIHGTDYYVSSGAVNTSNKFAQRLGRWEMRIRLPDVYFTDGYTLHSSAWLFSHGQEGTSGCSQEIDVLEQYMQGGAQNSIVQSAIHAFTGGHGSPCKHLSGGGVFGSATGDHTTDWHTFAVEWTADSLAVFRDNARIGTVTDKTQMHAMTDPQYFLFTACVMNRVPVRASNVFPQYYYVDYVKVWQWEDQMEDELTLV